MDPGVVQSQTQQQTLTQPQPSSTNVVASKPAEKAAVKKQLPVQATSDPLGAVPVENNDEFHQNEPSSEHVKVVTVENELPKNEEQTEESETKGKSRRVTFPHDGNMVSGSMDPPNPWGDACNMTTAELVVAYKESCDLHAVRPNNRLLSQLQGINEFKKRNETFSMRGEKCDHKSMETMESVFKRVQFNMLDFEATHLDDEGAAALFDMVEYYETCTKLNLAYNRNIGPRGWQCCARMLKRSPCVEYLDVRHCLLTEQSMPLLGRSLRLGAMLTTLHMENCSLSGRALLLLVGAIKMNEILRELFLADNRLMPSDGIPLGNMLKINHKLSLLDLRNNHLQDVGTSHICDGVYEQTLGVGLQTLVLWNNQLSFQGMPGIARALSSTKSLETLNLGHNNLTNEGIHRLKDGLMQNRSLRRVGLQAARIGCEGAVALAEFIAESSRLVRIDLRENDIKTGGLMALSLSLKVSTTVTEMDLDKDPKKENGVKDYVAQQSRLQEQINNYMQRNKQKEREAREEKERLARELKQKTEQLAVAAAILDDIIDIVTPPGDIQAEKKSLTLDIATKGPPQRAQTLESPALIPQSDLVFVPPPPTLIEMPEEEGSDDSKDNEKALHLPLDLPLGHVADTLKSPPIENIPSPLTDLSPTSRFIISKVVNAQTQAHEAGLPGPDPPEKSPGHTDQSEPSSDDVSQCDTSGPSDQSHQNDSPDKSYDLAGQPDSSDVSGDQIDQSDVKTLSTIDQSDQSTSSMSDMRSESNINSSGTTENQVIEDKLGHRDSAQAEEEKVQNEVNHDKNIQKISDSNEQSASIANTNSFVENGKMDCVHAQMNNSSQLGSEQVDLIIDDITSRSSDPLNGVQEAIIEGILNASESNNQGQADLDNLDVDEFEKELDEMLANVKSGLSVSDIQVDSAD